MIASKIEVKNCERTNQAQVHSGNYLENALSKNLHSKFVGLLFSSELQKYQYSSYVKKIQELRSLQGNELENSG